MKKDNHIIEIFKKHDGELLYVFLKNGSKYKVKNIAWGYDIGDEYAHITSNISPSEDGLSLDFFLHKRNSKNRRKCNQENTL